MPLSIRRTSEVPSRHGVCVQGHRAMLALRPHRQHSHLGRPRRHGAHLKAAQLPRAVQDCARLVDARRALACATHEGEDPARATTATETRWRRCVSIVSVDLPLIGYAARFRSSCPKREVLAYHTSPVQQRGKLMLHFPEEMRDCKQHY